MGRDEYREERVKKAVIKHGKTLWHYTDRILLKIVKVK